MKIMKKPLLTLLIFIFIIISSGCGNTSTVEPFLDNNQLDTKIKIINNQSSLLQKESDQFLKNSSSIGISADDVYQRVIMEENLDYFVVDVRSAADYAKGAIKSSVNIPYEFTTNPNLIGDLPKDKTIIVVCYTGHKAGQTVALWNMLGYNAVAMINGMSGWTAKESTLPTDEYNYPLVTTSSEVAAYESPSFEVEEVADIYSLIVAKSDKYLESLKGAVVNAKDLKADIDTNGNYFIVDIRKQDDYTKGHIEGAINVPYENIAEADNLAKLPSNEPIVLVGYDGTDASQVARVLNQLGYDSYALFYGIRVWSSNEELIGTAPISSEKINNLPTVELKYNLEGGSAGSAGCS
ncbi:MAG: rhodanese-like domain-containing protein [Vulcanibacillus sp.]